MQVFQDRHCFQAHFIVKLSFRVSPDVKAQYRGILPGSREEDGRGRNPGKKWQQQSKVPRLIHLMAAIERNVGDSNVATILKKKEDLWDR